MPDMLQVETKPTYGTRLHLEVFCRTQPTEAYKSGLRHFPKSYVIITPTKIPFTTFDDVS